MLGTVPGQRHGFVPPGAEAEEVAYLLIDPAEPLRRRKALEATHRVSPLLDAAMILLQVIIQVAIRAMDDSLSQLGLDSAGIGSMPIGGYTIRHYLNDDAS